MSAQPVVNSTAVPFEERVSASVTPAPVAEAKPLKLDIGCGPNKREGFIGVDSLPFDGKVDVVLNVVAPKVYKGNGVPTTWHGAPTQIEQWPWDDNSVDEVYSSHFVEHLTGAERIGFWNELYRVMKPGAKATITTPHWASGRAYGDPTHQWPPVVEFSWYYLDKGWRTANAPHVGLNCDFLATWGYSLAHPWSLKTQEAQAFALNHYREVAQDMIATITKR